ncbi:hypothetical protein, partial [Streptomyces sp. NPDC007856]|uniref:hypothetical protein n=1 Tax=Streptomyces sp. NPDC007856 TaxID=3364781 RepID=UPI0036C0820A
MNDDGHVPPASISAPKDGEPHLHAEVLGALRKMGRSDLVVDASTVMELHEALPGYRTRDPLHVRAEQIAYHLVSPHTPAGLPGSGKKKPKAGQAEGGTSTRSAGESSGQQTRSAVGPFPRVEESFAADEPVAVPNDIVRAVHAAAQHLTSSKPGRRAQVVTLTLNLLRQLPYPADQSVQRLVNVVAWSGDGTAEFQDRLLRNPQVVYAVARQDGLARLVVWQPALADVLGRAPGVLETLAAASENWYDFQTEHTAEILLRESVISELEADAALRGYLLTNPHGLQNLDGRMDILREIGTLTGANRLVGRSSDLAAVVVGLDEPAEVLSRLSADAALCSALATQIHRRPIHDSAAAQNFYRTVVTDEELQSVLRQFPEQLNVALASPDILEAARDPYILGALSESRALTNVLEDLPGVARRLLSDRRLIRAAVDNPDVALALSYNPALFDRIPDRQLLQALHETKPPELPAPRARDGRPAAPPADSADFPRLMQYLTASSPAAATVFNNSAVREMLPYYNGLAKEHQSVMMRNLRLMADDSLWPHEIRRIGNSPTLVLPEDDRTALAILRAASRHVYLQWAYSLDSAPDSVFTKLIGDPERSFGELLQHSPALAFLCDVEPRPLSLVGDRFLEYLHRSPLLVGAIERCPQVFVSLFTDSTWAVPHLENLLTGPRAPLARLLHRQHTLVYELTNEHTRAIVENLTAAPELLPKLEHAFGALSTTHWIRLLTDDRLYRLVAQPAEDSPLAGALVAFPEVLREAVARRGFVAHWEARRKELDTLASKARGNPTTQGKRSAATVAKAVRNLLKEVEAAGERDITPEGHPLDPEKIAAVKVLVDGLNRRRPVGDVSAALTGDAPGPDTVLARYRALSDDDLLRSAATGSPYLAQGLLFTPDMLELFQKRPSLLARVQRLPAMLRRITQVSRLPRLLADNDLIFAAFTESDLLWENYSAPVVASIDSNPSFSAVFFYRNVDDFDDKSFDLLKASPAAAKAAGGSEDAFRTIVNSPGLRVVLGTAGEQVVAAVVATQGRLDASAGDPRLASRLAGVPALADLLGNRPDIAADHASWTELVGNTGLMRRLAAHPDVITAVVTDPLVLTAAKAAPAFVEVLAGTAGAAHTHLTAAAMLRLVQTHEGLAEDLVQNSALRAAFAGLRGLAELVSGRPDVLSALRAHPELLDGLRTHRTLIDEAAGRTAVWEVARTHPALAARMNSQFRNWLRQRQLADLVIEYVPQPLSVQGAELLYRALRQGEVRALLLGHAGFAAGFLARPAWQERAAGDPSFAGEVRRLSEREPARFQELVTDSDPVRLLNALDAGQPQVTDGPGGVSTRSGADHTAGTAGVSASVPATDAATRTPDAAPTATASADDAGAGRDASVAEVPWEVAQLLAGPQGVRLAEQIGRHPELLALLVAAPAVAEELGAHPDRLGLFSAGVFFQDRVPAAHEGLLDLDGRAVERLWGLGAFDRLFDGFLSSVDVAPSGEDYDVLKAAARQAWHGVVSGRQRQLAELAGQRAARFAAFRADNSQTWQLSGRIHYAGRVVEADFTNLQREVLERVANGLVGVRESAVRINVPLHAHLDGGSGGVTFFCALAADGQVDVVVYAKSTARSGNDYRWNNSGRYIAGPAPLETVANDPVLHASRELTAGNTRDTGWAAAPWPKAPDSTGREVTARAATLAGALTDYHAALVELAAPGTAGSDTVRPVSRLVTAGMKLRALGVDLFTHAWDQVPEPSRQAADLLHREAAAAGTADGAPARVPEYQRGAVALVHHTAGDEPARAAVEVLNQNKSLMNSSEGGSARGGPDWQAARLLLGSAQPAPPAPPAAQSMVGDAVYQLDAANLFPGKPVDFSFVWEAPRGSRMDFTQDLRIQAPWVAEHPAGVVVVTLKLDGWGRVLEPGDGTTEQIVSHEEYARKLPVIADGMAYVLVSAEPGRTDLWRTIAHTTGRTVWSFTGPLRTRFHPESGYWHLESGADRSREATGVWMASDPDGPGPAVRQTIQGRLEGIREVEVGEEYLWDHPLVGPDRRTFGHALFSPEDWARREPDYRQLHTQEWFAVLRGEDNSFVNMVRAPWPGRNPYVFSLHGHADTMTFAAGRGTDLTSKIHVTGEGAVQRLRRRNSLNALPPESPIVLHACFVGHEKDGLSQYIANHTGRAVISPNTKVATYLGYHTLVYRPDSEARWLEFRPEPQGDRLTELAQRIWADEDTTLILVRRLRAVLGPDIDTRPEFHQLLDVLAHGYYRDPAWHTWTAQQLREKAQLPPGTGTQGPAGGPDNTTLPLPAGHAWAGGGMPFATTASQYDTIPVPDQPPLSGEAMIAGDRQRVTPPRNPQENHAPGATEPSDARPGAVSDTEPAPGNHGLTAVQSTDPATEQHEQPAAPDSPGAESSTGETLAATDTRTFVKASSAGEGHQGLSAARTDELVSGTVEDDRRFGPLVGPKAVKPTERDAGHLW